jgi:tyrosyl-tRNA synthetase
MALKKRLARELVTLLYSQKEAAEAEEHFAKVVQRQELPDDIPEQHVLFSNLTSEKDGKLLIDISRLLVEAGLAGSRSEANRLIAQAGVTIAGEGVTNRLVPPETIPSGTVIQVGKRRFAKIVIDKEK